LEFEELNEPALFRWISEYVEMHNGTISSADTRFLVSRIGSSQRTLQSELDKLLSYQSAISKEAIELLTVPTVQSSIFDLIDSAFAGRTTQTLDIYREQRMQKIEPLYIVAMITWQLHVIAIVKAGQGKSADTIARSAKINPYTVRKSSMLAQKMSMTQIKSLVSRTRDLERRLKRESIDSDEALLELLMHFN
jgi:DNA polymerase-3 subunit delta